MLAREILRTHLEQVKAAAGPDFSPHLVQWYLLLVLSTLSIMSYMLGRVPYLQTAVIPLPTGPHAIGALLAWYGLLNMFLALSISAKVPRLALSFATGTAYPAMLIVNYAGPAAWRLLLVPNILYVLFAFGVLFRYLSPSRFRSLFCLQTLAALGGVQGPLALLNLVPLSLLQTTPFSFDGWILFGFPIIFVAYSAAWATWGFSLQMAFLLLLPPILTGYSFVHLSQTLAIPSLSVLGLGGSGLVLAMILRILIVSLREKKTTDQEKPHTQSI